jgi:HSP20 family protein
MTVGHKEPVVRVMLTTCSPMFTWREPWHPPTNVYETTEHMVVKVDIAGVDAESLNISIDENMLRVRGRREECANPRQVAIHRLEIPYGDFETQVHLAVPIDREHVEATYQDGFLTITLPKERTRRVLVQTEPDSQ